MYVCMYWKIYNVPLLQPKQSRVHVRRPNRRDVSLACYRKVYVSVLDREVTMADYSTVLERRQQSCVVGSWTYERQALVLQCGLMETLEDDRAEL